MMKMAADRFFDIAWMDAVLCCPEPRRIVVSWKYKSGLKSDKWWYNHWIKMYPPQDNKWQIPAQDLKGLMIKVIQLKQKRKRLRKT
jgi:hypothetical protein